MKPGEEHTPVSDFTAGPDAAETFTLDISQQGAVYVRARDLNIAEGIHVDALDVRFPIPKDTEPEDIRISDLKGKRGKLSYLRFGVREDAAARILAPLTDNSLRVRFVPGGITMYAEQSDARIVLRAAVDTEEGNRGFSLTFYDYRVFGTIVEPPMAMLRRFAADLSDLFGSLEGAGRFSFAPHLALLTSWLPAAGWKIPATGLLDRFRVSLAGDRVYFTVASPDVRLPDDTEGISNLAAFEVAEAERLFMDAEAELAKGNLDEAAELYRRHSASHPFAARRLLWITSSSNSTRMEAREVSDRLLERNPNDPIAINVRACLDLESGDYRSAAEGFEWLSMRAVDEGDVLARVFADLMLGELLIEDDPTAAAQALESALALDPGNQSGLRTLATANIKRGEWHGAVKALTALLNRLEPGADQAEVYRDLGDLCLKQLADPETATQHFRAAQSLVPDDLRSMLGVARSAAAKGDAPGAIKAYDRVVEITTKAGDGENAALAHSEIGRLWEIALGRPENAVLRYEKALELDPTNRQALEWLWELRTGGIGELKDLVAVGRLLAAVLLDHEEYRRAADVRAHAAKALFDAGEEPETVAELYRQALEADANHPTALPALADLYEQQGQAGALVDSLRTAATRSEDPRGKARLLLRLAQILQEDEDGDPEALEALVNAAAGALGSVEGDEALDELVHLSRKLDVETQTLARVWEESPPGPKRARLALRIAMSPPPEDIGDEEAVAREAAIEDWFNRVVDEDPDSVEAQEALARYAETRGDYNEANERWNAAIEAASQDGPVRARMRLAAARLLMTHLDNVDAAERQAAMALTDDRVAVEAHDVLGHIQMARSDWANAARHLDEYARARFESLTYEQGRGLAEDLAHVHEMAGNKPQALRWRRELAAITPDDVSNLRKTAELAVEVSDFAAAVETFQSLVERAEDLGEPAEARAMLHLRIGTLAHTKLEENELAEQHLLAALALDTRAGAFDALIDLYTAQERWGELFELYESLGSPDEAAEATGQDKRASVAFHRQMVRVALEMLKDKPRAVVAYERLLQINPVDLEALEFLADRYREAKNWDAALETLEALENARTGASDDERAELKIARAEVAEQGEHLQKAAELLAEAAELQPASRSVLETLRRVLTALGRWSAVVDSLEAEAARTDKQSEQVNALLEAARVARENENDADRAVGLLERVLGIDSGSLPALDALQLVYESQERYGELIAILQQKADGLKDDRGRRISLLCQAARIAAEQLRDPLGAEELLDQARELDPDNPDVLGALEAVYRAEERWDDLARVLESRAENTDAAQRASLLVEAAEVREMRLEQGEASIELLQRAQDADPGSAEITQSLVKLHRRRGNFDEAIDVLETRARGEKEEEYAAALWLEAAKMRRAQLRDPATAVAGFREAIARAPEGSPTRADASAGLLEALVAANRAAEAAETLLEHGRSLDTTDPVRIDLLKRAAFAYEFLGGDPIAASTVLAQVLDANPGDRDARENLARAHARQKDFAAAVETLEPLTSGESLTAPVVRTYIDCLQQAERLDELYSFLAARARHGEEGAWATLRELAEKLDRWADLADLYRSAADNLDGSARAHALLSAARIFRGRVADMDASALCCRAAIEAAPDDPEVRGEALIGLEDAGDYETVYDVLMSSADKAKNDEFRRSLFQRAAEVGETLLGDSRRAADAFERILAFAPDDDEAAQAAKRLRTSVEDWEGLSRLLRLRAETAENPELRAERWRALGTHLEERLSDNEAAADAYGRSLEAAPDDATEFLLGAVLGRAGRWPDFAVRLQARADSRSGAERAQVLVQLAGIQRDQLDDTNAAIDSLLQAVTAAPDAADAAGALHDLLAREGRWAEVAALHAAAASRLELQPDADERVLAEVHARRASAANVFLGRLDDAASASKVLCTGFEGPDPAGAFQMAVRVATEANQDPLLASLYERAIDHGAFVEQRNDLLHQLGRIAKERLSDPEGAIDAFGRAFDSDPADDAAYRELETLYRLREDYESLADLYARASGAREGRVKADLLVSLAEIQHKFLNDTDGALASLQAATGADPAHPLALQALEGLYREREDWGALAQLYTARAEATDFVAERVRLYLQAGDLFDGALSDIESAQRAYRAALDAAEDKLPVLARLEALLRREEDSDGLVEILALRASLGGGEDTILALLEVSEIQKGKGDLDAALATLTEARTHDPMAREPLQRMRRIRRLQEDWLALDALLAEEEALAPAGAEAAGLARERGLLARDVMSDPGQARDHFRRALELDSTSAQSAADLAELAEGLGDRVAAAFALERLASSGDPSVDRAAAMLRAADHLRETGDALGAARRVEHAIALDPGRLGAWDLLALHEEQALRWEEARMLLLELLTRSSHAGDTSRTMDVYFRLGLAERHLDMLDKAATRFERVVQIDKTHRRAVGQLIEVLRARKDWKKLAKYLLEAVEDAASGAEAAEYLREAGRVFDRELGNPEQALKAYQRAVDAGSVDDDLASLRRVADLAYDLARWDQFLAAHQLLAPKETAPARALALAFRAGEAFRRKGIPKAATKQYERALELDPNHYPSFTALGGLLEAAGEWKRAVAAYEGALRTLPEEEQGRAGPLRQKLAAILADHLQDYDRAAHEYEKALELSPKDKGLRLRIAGVFARAKGRTVDAIREYQNILSDDPFRLECYRELSQMFESSQQLDRAFGMHSIIALLDPKDAKSAEFLEANQAKIQQGVQQALMTPVSDEDWRQLVVHPNAKGPMAELLVLADELIKVIFRPKDITKGARQIEPTSTLTRIVQLIRTRLGIDALELWVRDAATDAKRGSVADLIKVTSGEPPRLMVDQTLVKSFDPRAVLFLLGKLLARLRGGHEVFVRMKGQELIQLTEITTRLFVPDTEVHGLDADTITKRMDVVRKLIPKKARKQIEKAAKGMAALKTDPMTWVRSLQHGENRIGLLVCADMSQAARALLALDPALANQDLSKAPSPAALLRRSPAVVELLRFGAGEQYFELRRRTGLSLDQRVRGG